MSDLLRPLKEATKFAIDIDQEASGCDTLLNPVNEDVREVSRFQIL